MSTKSQANTLSNTEQNVVVRDMQMSKILA